MLRILHRGLQSLVKQRPIIGVRAGAGSYLGPDMIREMSRLWVSILDSLIGGHKFALSVEIKLLSYLPHPRQGRLADRIRLWLRHGIHITYVVIWYICMMHGLTALSKKTSAPQQGFVGELWSMISRPIIVPSSCIPQASCARFCVPSRVRARFWGWLLSVFPRQGGAHALDIP